MELKFLGRGAAFYPQEGGNSAFFIEGRELFVIDCGEGASAKLFALGVLGDNRMVDRITLFLTHTHSDHAGGLGTFAAYSFFKMNVPLRIVLPENEEYRRNIAALLTLFGSPSEQYTIEGAAALDGRYEAFQSVRYLETTHCRELLSFSLLFETDRGRVLYSGDTNETANIDKLVSERSEHIIHRIYIDFTTAESAANVHLNSRKLRAAVPEELSDRVYCMHFGNKDEAPAAIAAGFKAVELCEKL